MSELNELANHLAKNSEKSTSENINKDCRYLTVFLIYRDENFCYQHVLA